MERERLRGGEKVRDRERERGGGGKYEGRMTCPSQ